MDVPSSLSELRRLRYFLAVADERNFTRAAQRVHIAQPALSRQIRQLERDLGAQLFVRSPQGVELTDAGRLLQELGASLAAAEDRMWQQVRALATGRTGSLAFGYSTSTSYGTAPALLEALERQAPGLTVSARMLPTAEIVSGVADGLLDAGLVRCPPPVPDLVRTRIRLDRQGVLLPRDHPLARAAAVPTAALDGAALLTHPREENPSHFDAVAGLLARAGVEPRWLFRRVPFDAAHAPVSRGEALALVGESAAPGLPESLVWRPLDPPEALDVSLLTRAGRAERANPAVAQLLRAARALATEEGWLQLR